VLGAAGQRETQKEGLAVYEHVIGALDEHIAYQNWLLKIEKESREKAEKERDEAQTLLSAAREQIKLTSARAETAERERDALKAQLAAVPATMSRAEWDAHMDALHDGKCAGTLEKVNHELS
jgi:chromosome segregation ATPase